MPEAMGEVMVRAEEGLEPIALIAQDVGLNAETTHAILHTLRHEYAPLASAIRAHRANDLKPQLLDKAQMILSAIDEHDVEQAPLKDKTYALNILLEKHQLLSGLPTQRIDVEDRRALDEFLPTLMSEMNRRGMLGVLDAETQEVTTTDVRRSPGDRELDEAPAQYPTGMDVNPQNSTLLRARRDTPK